MNIVKKSPFFSSKRVFNIFGSFLFNINSILYFKKKDYNILRRPLQFLRSIAGYTHRNKQCWNPIPAHLMIPFPLDIDGSSRTREALGPFSDHASITFYSGPNSVFCPFHSFLAICWDSLSGGEAERAAYRTAFSQIIPSLDDFWSCSPNPFLPTVVIISSFSTAACYS